MPQTQPIVDSTEPRPGARPRHRRRIHNLKFQPDCLMHPNAKSRRGLSRAASLALHPRTMRGPVTNPAPPPLFLRRGAHPYARGAARGDVRRPGPCERRLFVIVIGITMDEPRGGIMAPANRGPGVKTIRVDGASGVSPARRARDVGNSAFFPAAP